MKKFLFGTVLIACWWAGPTAVYAQEQTPSVEITYSSTPVPVTEVKTELHVDVQQPAPAPAPAPVPDVNIQVHDSAPAAPSVSTSSSVKESSVTKIVETAPVDSSSNVAFLLVGGLVAVGLAFGLYSLAKGR